MSTIAGPLPKTNSPGPDLAAFADQTIQGGSKSFSLASRIFGERERVGAHLLYAWCRYCDDAIDDSPNPAERLVELQTKTRAAFDLHHRFQNEPVFQAFQKVAIDRKIPVEYALDLLDGMRLDVEGARYETIEDLAYYCYCVAGAVGLMMVHVMGTNSAKALPHAVDLGIAFQMTNVSRDVLTDAKMGRIYLLLPWLRELGVPEDPSQFEKFKPQLASATRQLLKIADAHYASAYKGLKYLSLRAAWTIAAAAEIYSAIGYEVLRRGPQAWDERVVISKAKKIFLAAKALFRVIPLIPIRVITKWTETTESRVWRFKNEYRYPPQHD